MEFSAIGRAALRAREGERLTAYYDSVGVITISVGVTNATGLIKITPGLKITAEQSDKLFAQAVQAYVKTVQSALKVPVTQEFFDACVSLCYNIGQGGFAKSTVVKLANAGQLEAAANAFMMWKKPAEIISRRQAESDQAKSSYAKGLPKARSNDKAPVKLPVGAGTIIPTTAVTPAPKPAASTESGWSKLGSALTKFFSR